MLYEAIIIAIPVALLFGGKLSNLARIGLKSIWLVFLAFGLQLGMDYLGGWGYQIVFQFRAGIHGLSYLLLFLFLWQNRGQPGGLLLAAGFFLNFLVIMANDGTMPTVVEGMPPELAGMVSSNKVTTYSVLTEQTKLPWLADIMYQPWPKAYFSIGDVFISLGIFWTVFKTMVNRTHVSKITSLRIRQQ